MTTSPSLELRTCSVGSWPMNSYALVCPATRKSILIDPGAEPKTLLKMLHKSSPIAILITHTHADHIGVLDEMQQRLGVPIMAHPGPHAKGVDLYVDRELQDGDRVEIGNHTLSIVYTPGHSADMLSVILVDDHRIIVGDTIFKDGPGKTWSSKDFQTTLNTLRTIVLSWPDETICYPGHGTEFCLADRRADIESFLARRRGGFFGDITWYD